MANWLIVVVLLAAISALGSAVVMQFAPWSTLRTLNGLFAGVTLGAVLGGWLGLLLAELGLFSLVSLLVVWGVVFAVLILVAYLRRDVVGRNAVPGNEMGGYTGSTRILYAALVVWLMILAALFLRPHEYILGGADAGVYVSTAAEIAQNGGFVLHDELLASLDDSLRAVFLRPVANNPAASAYLLPGFFVTEVAGGTVAPQFYPFHPLWQAIAFSLGQPDVTAVRATLLLPGLWMMLASLAVALVAWELQGVWASLLVMAALPLTALQVWFARYPTTEALTQFLLWAGLWAMILWQSDRQPTDLWALSAGAALGATFLVRIDMLVILPILAVFVVVRWLQGWTKNDTWFALPLALLVAHSVLHGVRFSAPYFYQQIGFGLRLLQADWWVLLLAGVAVALGIALLLRFRERYRALVPYAARLARVLALAFFLYAIYGWFVRPVLFDSYLRPDLFSETLLLTTNHENWLRLGWYLSPVGVWLGVAGICVMIWRVERRTAVLVATGVLFTVLYLGNVRANPHQIYVMRRFVPMVAPFFLLAAGLFIAGLPGAIAGWLYRRDSARQVGRLLAAGLAVIWLALLGWSARGFVSQVDHLGLVEQLSELDQRLEPRSILLFYDQSPVGLGDFWGTPLKYIYGHEVFNVRDLEALAKAPLAESIEFWQNNGRSVVWIGDPEWLNNQGISFVHDSYTLSSQSLEGSYEHKPQAIQDNEWNLSLAFLTHGSLDGE